MAEEALHTSWLPPAGGSSSWAVGGAVGGGRSPGGGAQRVEVFHKAKVGDR